MGAYKENNLFDRADHQPAETSVLVLAAMNRTDVQNNQTLLMPGRFSGQHVAGRHGSLSKQLLMLSILVSCDCFACGAYWSQNQLLGIFFLLLLVKLVLYSPS
jgi:hypothetical protein